MKRWLLTLFTVLLGVTLTAALPTDSTAVKEKGKTSSAPTRAAGQKSGKKASPAKNPQTQQKKLKGFVDLNANGIDDRLEGVAKGSKMQQGKGKRKDRFIDRDGDGICDGQESALGLQKLYQRRRRHSGRK